MHQPLHALSIAWVLGDSLTAFLWKGLCIQAAVAALLALMRPQDAKARYTLLCLALLLCVGVLAVDICQGYSNLTVPGRAMSDSGLFPTALDGESMPQVPSGWRPWLALAWLAGVASMTLRFCAGMTWLRGLVRASQPWTDAAWRARVAGMARRLQMPREVGLGIVQGLSSPVTAGWLKPVILVPANVITGMPADLLEALLAHELAHIRRLDYLVNLLQHIAEALLFFHPSAWWLSRRIRVERERIADGTAAALIGSPLRMARALDALSRYVPADEAPPYLAQRASGGELVDRIRRLLHPIGKPARRPWSAGATAIPMLTAALATVGVAAWPALAPAPPRVAGGPGDTQAMLVDFPDIDGLVEASKATHVLVVDSRSGGTLIGRAEHDIVPIASLTKLMTAMVVLDAAPDLTQAIRIDEQDAEATKGGASQLPVGTLTTLGTLLKLALMSSDNRAAHALARSYPGGMTAFTRALRRKTAALDLEHTTLEEPTGISSSNRSTASDIERIVRAAARYPDIARDTIQATETVVSADGAIRYRNTNPLVGRQGWDIRLSKTAMSDAAGRCLVMRVHIRDRDLTLVLLNAAQQIT